MRRNGTIKAKVLLTVLGLLMLTLLVGCGLANYTYIGFILMSVGGGGFLLVILSLIAVSALLEKRRNKARNFSIEDNAHFKIGRVARCELYKQNVSQTRKQGEHAMLFKIWVNVEICGKKKTLRPPVSVHQRRERVYFRRYQKTERVRIDRARRIMLYA